MKYNTKFVIVLIPLIFYLFISIFIVNRPGLYYDEVLFARSVVSKNDSVYELALWRMRIPIMVMPYLGALKSWIYAPIAQLIGISAFSIRILPILTGMFSLILIYKTVQILLNNKSALIFLIILSTLPSYIFHVRLDWGPVALSILFRSILIYSLVKYTKTKNITWLAVAGFSIGLGIFDKLTHLWFVFGIIGGILAVKPKLKYITFTGMILFLTFILAGSAPLLLYIYNIGLRQILGEPIIKYQEFPAYFGYKLWLLIWTLSGNSVFDIINNHDILRDCVIHQPNLSECILKIRPFAFPFSIAPVLLITAIFKALFSKNIYLKISVISFILIFLQIVISYRARGSHHLMMLFPLTEFIIFSYILNNNRIFVKYLLLLLLILSNLITDFKYLANIKTNGGTGLWSTKIYDLCNYIKTNPNFYVFMDWGFQAPLSVLNCSSSYSELFWEFIALDNEEHFVNKLHQLTIDPNVVFVFHSSKYTVFYNPREFFFRMIKLYRLETIKFDQSFQPEYELIKIFRDNSKDADYSEINFKMRSFIGDIRFLGYNLIGLSKCDPQQLDLYCGEQGSVIILYLYFLIDSHVPKNYKFFVHLIGEINNPQTQNPVWDQMDQEPHNWTYPTTQWIPGKIVKDRYELRIPQNAPEGRYFISIGMYDPNSMSRLLTTGDGADGNSVKIANILVKK